MMKIRSRSLWFVASVVVAVVILAQDQGRAEALRAQLASALIDQDAAAIRQAVANINRHLGEKAGVPDTPLSHLSMTMAGESQAMLAGSTAILDFIASVDDPQADLKMGTVSEAISEFVDRFR
jgi:hypothetical protein